MNSFRSRARRSVSGARDNPDCGARRHGESRASPSPCRRSLASCNRCASAQSFSAGAAAMTRRAAPAPSVPDHHAVAILESPLEQARLLQRRHHRRMRNLALPKFPVICTFCATAKSDGAVLHFKTRLHVRAIPVRHPLRHEKTQTPLPREPRSHRWSRCAP